MKRLLPLACFLPALLMGLVALGLTGGYAVNVTPSLERGIYKASTASPSRGDIVGFCLDGAGAHLAAERAYLAPGSCTSGLRPLLKYLAGMPGDVVTVTPDGILCGPAAGPRCLWPAKALPVDSQGRPLPPSLLHDGVIPAGQALVLTAHPGGFDSRYFGLVPLAGLTTYTPFFITGGR